MPFRPGEHHGTPFRKGQNVNGGGRPSTAKALDALGTTSGLLLQDLVQQALEWMRDGSEPDRQKYAHMWLTERVLRIGRPKDEIDLNVGGPSAEQLAHLEALRMTPHERRLAAQDTTEAPHGDDDTLGA